MSVNRRLWVAFMAGGFSQSGCRLINSPEKAVALGGAVIWIASVVVFVTLTLPSNEQEN